MIISREEIKVLIPHRKPFLFLDSCDIIEVGKKGIGYRKFLIDEYFFVGHFPNMPIVPGVILIESLAQTAGVVVAKGFSKDSLWGTSFRYNLSERIATPLSNRS